VVGVVMRQEDRRDLVEREPGAVEHLSEPRDGTGEADVDENDPAIGLDCDGVEHEFGTVSLVRHGEVVHAIGE
jgi:hypothetical protein